MDVQTFVLAWYKRSVCIPVCVIRDSAFFRPVHSIRFDTLLLVDGDNSTRHMCTHTDTLSCQRLISVMGRLFLGPYHKGGNSNKQMTYISRASHALVLSKI